MPAVKWNAFCISSSVAKSFVHFMPVSRSASAPYPVVAKVEIFGVGFPKRAVVIEGSRLQQPDGIKLNDLIPDLVAGFTGMLGFSFELSLQQSHADLYDSRCYVELQIVNDLLRYQPAQDRETGIGSDLVLLDQNCSYSVVFVNSGMNLLTAEVKKSDGSNFALDPSSSDGVVKISPWSVLEFHLSDADLIDGVQELKDRRIKQGAVFCEYQKDLAVYLVCRYRQNQKFLSVRPL